MDKLDHAQVRYYSPLSVIPAVLDITNRIEEYVYLISPSHVLTLALASGDNFGTSIRIYTIRLTASTHKR